MKYRQFKDSYWLWDPEDHPYYGVRTEFWLKETYLCWLK